MHVNRADSGKLHAVDKDANSSNAGATGTKVEEIVDPQTLADLEVGTHTQTHRCQAHSEPTDTARSDRP